MLNEKIKKRIEHFEIVFQERSLTKLASNELMNLANSFSKLEKSFQEKHADAIISKKIAMPKIKTSLYHHFLI